MAALVCEKINMQQSNDLAACKNWFIRRHELLWNESLWKDSLISYTQVLSPDGYTTSSTWLPDKSILLCPAIIGQVVAARLDANRMNVQRQEYYYRISYDSFTKVGNPTEFLVLPSCIWEWETPQSLNVLALVGDAAVTMTLDTLDTDNIGVTRLAVRADTNQGAFAATERIDKITKPTTTAAMGIGTLLGITCVNSSSGAVTFSTAAGSVVVPAFSTGLCPSRAGITYVAANYGGPSEDVSGSFPNFYGTASTSGVGTLSYDGAWYGTASTDYLITVPALTLSMPQRQRIKLLFKPEQEVTIRVLGKRVCPTFSADNDEPAIAAMTNCLIAFVHADMLERARRYGQAQAKQAEGLALLEQLKKIETVQQANEVHIEPQEGLGGQWQFNSAVLPQFI